VQEARCTVALLALQAAACCSAAQARAVRFMRGDSVAQLFPPAGACVVVHAATGPLGSSGSRV
jgi:hypothetical protein